MHMSAVDRANTKHTSITSRTGLERSRQQAWRGTAKGKGKHYHHDHDANLCSTLFWHGKGAVFFLRCGNELREINNSSCLPFFALFFEPRDENGAEASCFLAFVWCRRAEIDDASTKIPLFFLFQPLHTLRLSSTWSDSPVWSASGSLRVHVPDATGIPSS